MRNPIVQLVERDNGIMSGFNSKVKFGSMSISRSPPENNFLGYGESPAEIGFRGPANSCGNGETISAVAYSAHS